MSLAHQVEGFASEPSRRTRGAATGFWRVAPWITRITLILPAVLFVRIGSKYLTDPIQAAAASGISLDSAAAVTDIRAFGAMFLAVAALLLAVLFGTRRLLAGLTLTATVVGLVTAARILGIRLDGPAPESLFKLVPELVLLAMCALGFVVELARRRCLGKA
jgi:hypothetical protein